MQPRIYFISLLMGVSAFWIAGCGASIPQIPASGMIGGRQIETTVDSESARYYLEHYLAGHRENAAFDMKVDQLHADVNGGIPDRAFLMQLSESFSVDFAALFLADRILADNENKAVEAIYQHELGIVRADIVNRLAVSGRIDSTYLTLFVPGWDYAASGSTTGADFAHPRQIISELGIENLLIEIEPTGAIETNAQIVANEVSRHLKRNRSIILVSASSGGPATALALGGLLPRRQAGRVKAWVNIGGILQGSPVSDHYLTWPRSWLARMVLLFKGWDINSIRSMSVKASRARYDRLRFPEDLLIINYIGIPLSGDISKRASSTYPVLRKYGPNDGFTLITDELAPNSVTITDIGRDHFFNEDPEIGLKTVALARTVFTLLQKHSGKFHAAQSRQNEHQGQ